MNKGFIFPKLLVVAVFSLIILSCSTPSNKSEDVTDSPPAVPSYFPPLQFPADNSYSKVKAQLGRMLFYEKSLSKDSTISCSSCHKLKYAFSDNTPISLGIGKEPSLRNSSMNANLAYRNAFHWDGGVRSLEDISINNMLLGSSLSIDTNILAERLNAVPAYRDMFSQAFGEAAVPKAYLAAKAIATFLRTIISGNSPYDKYLKGDKNALSEEQIRGMYLFFSERTKCSSCHSGIFFTDGKYHNTGTTTHYFDRGRYYVTNNDNDRGKFLTPSLRNVELTAPYSHDGEQPALEDVIENYSIGGKPFITKDTLLKTLNLTPGEKVSIISFLKALTDSDFINNPDYR